MTSIRDYLKKGLVVNVFYLRDSKALQHQLFNYLLYGVHSLERRHPRRAKSNCEYKVYQTLVFLDCLRDETNVCHIYYGEITSFFSRSKFPLLCYLVDYILSPCTLDCVNCTEFDFFTHYAKNMLLNTVQHVQLYKDSEYSYYKYKVIYNRPEVVTINDKETYFSRVPKRKIIENHYSTKWLFKLGFEKIYLIVGLKTFGDNYIINTFYYTNPIEQSVCNYYLSKDQYELLPDNYRELIATNKLFIRLVVTQPKKRYFIIQFLIVKSITQLKKS